MTKCASANRRYATSLCAGPQYQEYKHSLHTTFCLFFRNACAIKLQLLVLFILNLPCVGNCQYYYQVNYDDTITITGYYGSGGAITIPYRFQIADSSGNIIWAPVTGIYSSAFASNLSLTRVTIPDSVNSIGGNAFLGCNNLTSATIGNSVTTIGNDAFGSCASLSSVTIGTSVANIGDGAFYSCPHLTSINIPNSVITIGNNAFESCGLTSVTIPNNVTSIGDYAFMYCYSLSSLTIGNNVARIGNYAFCDCTHLTSFTIPISVTSIGNNAFYLCTSLISVYFQGNPSLGSYVFSGDNNVTFYYSFVTPTISSQPQPQTVYQGSNATFNVTASGTQPLYYQWWFNGTNITGAATNTYTITNVQPTNVGNYMVVITNIAGAVTSSPAFLNVASIGQINQVLSLDGTSGYVSVPSSSDLQNPTEITVEAWVYPKPPHSNINGNYGFFIAKSDAQNATSQRSYEMNWAKIGNGEGIIAAMFFSDGTWSQVWASLPETNWVHVAFTFSSTSGLFQLFTNGVLANTANALTGKSLRQTTLPLNLGGETIVQGPLFAAGYMDEVRIWNKARTQVDIAESRFCYLTGSESNLVSYWNFDTGTSSDLTGHGHDGTLNGGVSIIPIPTMDVVHQGICGAPYIDTTSIVFSWATGFHQTVYGPSGLNLEIDASTNLVNWLPLIVLTNFSGQYQFTDPAAMNLPNRFYRSVAK